MKIFRSIRWRLLLWYGALLGSTMAGLGTIAYQHEQTVRLAAVDRDLLARVAQLAGALTPGNRNRQERPSPDGHGPRGNDGLGDSDGHGSADAGKNRQGSGQNAGDTSSSPAAGMKRGKTLQLSAEEITTLIGPEGFYYAVRPNHRPLTLSSNAPADLALPTDERGGLRTRGLYREAFLFPAKEDCVLAGISLVGERAAMRRYLGLLCALGTSVLAVALAGGWVLTTRALRPIASITSAASQIAEGDLSRRIDVNETDSELGGMADLLNATFARLAAAFDDQARFTSDAAHELRTPLAVILLHAQRALAGDRLAPDQRAAIEACERGAQRMRGLIESLLQLARLDARYSLAQPTRLDLSEVTEEVVESLRIVAARRGVKLTFESTPSEMRGDAVQLGQVVTNLVGNAIQHGSAGGRVLICVRCEDGDAILQVADDGPGIAEKHAPHVFDRFYRGDEARSSATGRSGLGLAIAKAIVETHFGTIELHSHEGQGATFTVRLRRAP